MDDQQLLDCFRLTLVSRLPLFRCGRLLATPGALNALAAAGQRPQLFLSRHLRGDWGDLGSEDKSSNDRALTQRERIFSAYHTAIGTKLWVITEADRSATTILLPEEY